VTGAQHTVRNMTDVLAQTLNNPMIPAIGMALAGTFSALWLAAAWWAYRDATRRAGSSFVGLLAAAWIVISSPFLLPLSLGVYTLARPQHTAAEGRSRRLAEELVAQLDAAAGPDCPTCGASVESSWLRCPTCATWLAQPCGNCGRWSESSLQICPWCGSEERKPPDVETFEPAATIAGSRKTRRRQAHRQAVGVMARDARPGRGRESLLDQRSPARAGTR
jgi:hypothetical protein